MMWFYRFIQSHLVLTCFTAAYLLASLVGVLVTGNTEFAFYLVSLLLIIAVFLLLHRRVTFSQAVLWSLSIWGLAHMVGGLVPSPPGVAYHGDTPVMYSVWLIEDVLKYDHVVHAFGFGTCVFVCQQALQAVMQHGESADTSPATRFLGFGPLLLCILAALGLGATNEIMEFAATRISPDTNVGGYVNTALDLVANTVGAIVAAALIVFRHQAPAEPRQSVAQP